MRTGVRLGFREVHVEIRDHNGRRIAEVVRPPGLFALPLEVLDGGRYPVGTVSAGRRRFAIRDTSGRPLGTIGKAKRGYWVDYTIQDAVFPNVP